MKLGAGLHTYEVVEGWPRLPDGWAFTQTPAVVVDSQDRVYVFNRSAHPVIVFDRDGRFLHAWGEDVFMRAHGLWIDAHDHLYFVDMDAHLLVKCTTEGKVLMTVGTKGVPHPDGSPFNIPTDVAVRSDGVFYVSDGYGNSRVHKFAPDGRLLSSWGEPGDRPGQFNLPHGIHLDRDGRVYVADRENHRVQVFTPDGAFITQWTGFVQPCDLFIDARDHVYIAEGGGHRVSVRTLDGTMLASWGGMLSAEPGQFNFAHSLWVDSRGDLYVAEIFGERMQKFVRHT